LLRGDGGDDFLGADQLIDAGLSRADARRVLGPHSAITRAEASERLEMLRRSKGGAA
jgi:hypothetical protein